MAKLYEGAAENQKFRIKFFAIAEVSVVKFDGKIRLVSTEVETFTVVVDEVPGYAFKDGKTPPHAVNQAEKILIDKIDLKYYPHGILKSWKISLDPHFKSTLSKYARFK